jgi:hypothetical protein
MMWTLMHCIRLKPVALINLDGNADISRALERIVSISKLQPKRV